MKIPRSEAEAYRLLLLTIGYFALIVAGSWINRWLGLAVFVVLSLWVVWRTLGRRNEKPRRAHVEHRGPESDRRILVIANETVQGSALRDGITEKEHRGVEVPGIYWHFVDIMWIVVYCTVYLL